MKYVGFRLPFDEEEWREDVTLDGGDTVFYIVDAKNIKDARRQVFKEIYENEWDKQNREMYSLERARLVLQDVTEDEIIKMYGEHDGNLIIQISCEYLDLDEETQKKWSLDERITRLSEKSIFELAFEVMEIQIGIGKSKILK